MHLLSRLRRGCARRALPQWRWRARAPPAPPAGPAAPASRRDTTGLQAARMCARMTLRASRRGLVPPFIAMDVLRAANEREAAGADVIHLEVGQPATPAPDPVLEA